MLFSPMLFTNPVKLDSFNTIEYIHGYFNKIADDAPGPQAEGTRAGVLRVDGGPLGFDLPYRPEPAFSWDVWSAAGAVLLPGRSRQRHRACRYQIAANSE